MYNGIDVSFMISIYAGKNFLVWAGPTPMISISTPELIREVFTKMHDFQKAKFSPIFDKLFPGLVSYEGEKWAQHRKIINPAFHMEKLKVFTILFSNLLPMIPTFSMIKN